MSSHHICNDLLVQIFEKLPPKSIIRFRSLSKYWHSRLATPEFIRNHRLQSPQKVLIRHTRHYEFKDIYTLHSGDRLPLFPGPGYVGIPGVELPPSHSLFRSSIVGSCNGILCVLDCNNISLWNLSIRRRLIVPNNQSSPLLAVGLGFDPITDDYKVVTVSYGNKYNLDENSTFIYSLKQECWRAIPSPSTRFYNVKSKGKACFFNGVLHWVVEGYITAETTTENWTLFILTFDLSSHVFGHILLPGSWRIRQLTTINGCLAVVSYKRIYGDSWIWVMKEYGKFESWCVVYGPPVTRGVFDHPMDVFQPIANGDTLAYYYKGGSEVYNFETGLLTEIARFPPCCSTFEMDAYVESLELIDKEHAAACGETVNHETNRLYKRTHLYSRYL
ncbi:hypothetical protein SSX86_002905 [Deinandra increscens subsp. villosa]|uniref:F-box domain-containing protein n=1 Tax=Deinandra increscens subsp. villosa TaxID=3103831 RepID=A0AAP0DTR6_9ASTR